MERKHLEFLDNWLKSQDRKPLVIRGPRQVGKTWLVRHFCKHSNRKLIELNFEKKISYASFFESNDPEQILLNISATLHEEIDPNNSLLFLDEIQAAPEILSKLRWFSEELPELPLIAAGSLLEFILTEHSFSMPVGRISYLYLEPLSFEEFLLARNKKNLLAYLSQYDFNIELPLIIHEELTNLFKEYVLVGGMPAAVSSWITERSLNKINQIHHDLITTYQDDFAKYKGRIEIERLEEIMMMVPRTLSQKFIFRRVNTEVKTHIIKAAVKLLNKAGICHPVTSCTANGVPLGAGINEKFFKEIFLDIGLCSAVLGLTLNEINQADELILINRGGIAEQAVGQMLRTLLPPYIEPTLYYWLREEPGSEAEVDYVIQSGSQVIPIEVKAGSTGNLKSLHIFMALKKLSYAIRINSDMPSKVEVNVKLREAENIRYRLLSLPFYLSGQIHRLLKNNQDII